MGKILCFLGIHSWAYSSKDLPLSDSYRICRRCYSKQKAKYDMSYGSTYYE